MDVGKLTKVTVVDQLDPLYTIGMSDVEKTLSSDNLRIVKVAQNQYNVEFLQTQADGTDVLVSSIRLTDYLLGLLEGKASIAVSEHLDKPDNMRRRIREELEK